MGFASAIRVRSRWGARTWTRVLRRVSIVAAACLVGASAADAAEFAYTASLDLHLGTVDSFRLDAGGQISVDPDGSFVLPAGIFATTRTLIPLQTTSEVVASVQLQMANAQGTFSGPMSAGGVMQLTGQAVLNLQTPLGFDPLSLGISPIGTTGTAMASGSNGSFAVTVSLTGAPWQTGVFVQKGTTASGSTFTQRTNTGSDLRTAGGEGIVTLVVPAYITTRVDGDFSDRIPVSGVLTITFVPEPALLVGQGAIVVAVLLLHRQRRRARRDRQARSAQGADLAASEREASVGWR